MTQAERQQVAERAEHCCEYCFSQSRFSGDDFGIEHIRPRVAQGGDDPENLAWCCQGCNNRKFTAQEAIDPVTGTLAGLYNPRQDVWREHFAWSHDFARIEGISSVGRATVSRLDLNRTGLVNLRDVLRRANLHPPVLSLFAVAQHGNPTESQE